MKLRKEFTCPLEYVHDIIRGKWKAVIIYQLFHRKVSSLADLRRDIKGISEKVLIDQLNDLIEYEIVQKETFDGYPLRVEYSLTADKGQRIIPALDILQELGREYIDKHTDKKVSNVQKCFFGYTSQKSFGGSMKKALIIIDLQYDYFEGGKYPLWNTDVVLENIKTAITKANNQSIPVIFVEHIVPKEAGGLAPFFNEGTHGAKIHEDLLALAPNAKIVTKAFADAFYQTNLEAVLEELQVEKILICGMMTQNCVTHTAISRSAEKYEVKLLPECTTTVDEMLHNIALHAISTRVGFETLEEI